MSTNEIIILCLIVALVAGVIAFHVGCKATMRAIRRGMKWELTQAEAAEFDRMMTMVLAEWGEYE